MLKVFIAEDEKASLNSLINIIETYCPETILSGFSQTVENSVSFLSQNKIDLALLDINFPDGTGFDILKKLKSYDFKIIFITAFDKYALQAIKFSAADYLLKPLDPKELISSIQKLKTKKERNTQNLLMIETLLSNINNSKRSFEKIVLRTAERIQVVEIKDIMRCESDNSYTTFYLTENRRVIVSKVLKEFDEMLSDAGFIRTHKSHLVNINFINSFEKSSGGYLVLKDQTQIPVSVRKREIVFETFKKFLS